jgi:peptidoglycan/xylan/chitin deacetylase (PgdA/CDA1 family)
MKGIFTISLDFELHWGGFEKWPIEQYRKYFHNTREVIPAMLTLFEQHQVHVTWATVGMLLHDSKQGLLQNAPRLKPAYDQKELSAYHFIESMGIGNNEADDPLHFAPTLVKQILATPFQELGTHTFAHYYCNEAGQTLDQFREDIRAAKRVAATYSAELRSLVFPRNQFNDQYLRACYEEGITSVRSNPLDWFWKIDSTQSESMWKRLNRGADAYWPVGKRNTYQLMSLPVSEGLPLCIPASRLLRPYNPKEFFLNTMKIDRIKAEMSRAAERGEVYHLWWHPHNFGSYPEQSMTGLRTILEHYSACRSKWNMSSATMNELTQLRLNEG